MFAKGLSLCCGNISCNLFEICHKARFLTKDFSSMQRYSLSIQNSCKSLSLFLLNSFYSQVFIFSDSKSCKVLPSIFFAAFSEIDCATGVEPTKLTAAISGQLRIKSTVSFAVKFALPETCLNPASSCQTFEDFLYGKLKKFPNKFPTVKDLENHISTIFTDVRIKQYIEMRGADSGSWNRICALPAFWVGLLYSKKILDQIFLMIKNWKLEEIYQLNKDVQKYGLKSKLRGKKIQHICVEILRLAQKGLSLRNYLNKNKENEEHFLNILFEIAHSGVTPAEKLISKYVDKNNNCSDKIFIDNSY